MTVRRYADDLRLPWSGRSPAATTSRTRSGKASAIVRVAWSHLARSRTRASPDAQAALALAEEAERAAAKDSASAETLLSVVREVERIRAAVRALP